NYGAATFADKNVGNGKTVTVTGINLNGADAGNYTFNSTATTTANITPFALTVGATGVNRVYDGTVNATVTLTDDRFAGDVLTANYGSASFADKNVGTGKAVSVSGITLGGTDAGNYTFNSTGATTANITPKALSISGTNKVFDKVYDGTTAAQINAAALTGVVGADNVLLTAAFLTKDAGRNKAVTVSLGGADAGNYSLGALSTLKATISKADLVITATAADKVYDRTRDATVTFSDNRIAGDVLDISANSLFDNKYAGIGKEVNVRGIKLTGADADNYTFNRKADTIADILQRSLIVTADNKTMAAGGTFPVFTYTIGGMGLAPLDNPKTMFTGKLSTNAGAAPAAGVYQISQGTLSVNPNYTITQFINGQLTAQ
ncbi:MAG: YDG domain-containing protein, partial [Alphaproteobacteria bacterium]